MAERCRGRRARAARRWPRWRARPSEGTDLWGECLATGQARPAPWTGIDGFFHMAPIVALRGTEACNAYYRLLRDELRDRVGARHRRPRARSGTGCSGTTCPSGSRSASSRRCSPSAASTSSARRYTNAWAEAGAPHRPARTRIGSAARRLHPHHPQPGPAATGSASCAGSAREYQVDGAVLHSDRSCKPYSIGQIDLKDRLAERARASGCCCSRPTTPTRAPGPRSRPTTGSPPSWRASR